MQDEWLQVQPGWREIEWDQVWFQATAQGARRRIFLFLNSKILWQAWQLDRSNQTRKVCAWWLEPWSINAWWHKQGNKESVPVATPEQVLPTKRETERSRSDSCKTPFEIWDSNFETQNCTLRGSHCGQERSSPTQTTWEKSYTGPEKWTAQKWFTRRRFCERL